jgi:hypothetical protein
LFNVFDGLLVMVDVAVGIGGRIQAWGHNGEDKRLNV